MNDHNHLVIVSIVTLCSLLMLFSMVRHYAKNSLIPPEAWTLLVGIGYGLALKLWGFEDLPRFELSPEVIILVFLPLLIFSSGRLIDLGTLKTEALPIGFFAVIGVFVTSVLIGAPIAWILDLGIVHGLLIGAAAGATDPAAVGAIFRSYNIPERLSIIVEGESLFNDGTTVVLFVIISGVAVADGMPENVFSVQSSLLYFAWAILAAVPLGAIVGWLGAKILNAWKENNVFFEVSMTFVITYLTFVIGEKLLHVSGVISVLLAAIVFIKTRFNDAEKGQYENSYAKDHVVLDEFWDYFSAVLNGVLFFSLGVATGLHDFSEVPEGAVAVAIVSLVIARLILVYAGCGLINMTKNKIIFAWQHVLFLGGLRGAVSAALILLIPHDYEYRGIFLCLAFAMIAFTLIVQPTLMSLYLRRRSLA